MPEDETTATDPTPAQLEAQMNAAYEEPTGDNPSTVGDDESVYADGVDDDPTNPAPSDTLYTRADLEQFGEALIAKFAANQAQGAPNPGLAPTHPEAAADPWVQRFTDADGNVDEYGLDIARRVAEITRAEMGQAVRPMLMGNAETTIYAGLEPEAAEILRAQMNDPNAPIDPLMVAGNPLVLKTLRQSAQFEAAQAARTVAPRSDRGYNPTRRSSADPSLAADLAILGTVPGVDPKSLR